MSGVVVEDESRFSGLINSKVPHSVMIGLSLSWNPFPGCVTSGTQVFSSVLVQDISFVASTTSSTAVAVFIAAAVAVAASCSSAGLYRTEGFGESDAAVSGVVVEDESRFSGANK